MSNEEFEWQMELILQQQSRFDANFEKQQQQSAEDWAKQRERNAEVESPDTTVGGIAEYFERRYHRSNSPRRSSRRPSRTSQPGDGGNPTG